MNKARTTLGAIAICATGALAAASCSDKRDLSDNIHQADVAVDYERPCEGSGTDLTSCLEGWRQQYNVDIEDVVSLEIPVPRAGVVVRSREGTMRYHDSQREGSVFDGSPYYVSNGVMSQVNPNRLQVSPINEPYSKYYIDLNDIELIEPLTEGPPSRGVQLILLDEKNGTPLFNRPGQPVRVVSLGAANDSGDAYYIWDGRSEMDGYSDGVRYPARHFSYVAPSRLAIATGEDDDTLNSQFKEASDFIPQPGQVLEVTSDRWVFPGLDRPEYGTEDFFITGSSPYDTTIACGEHVTSTGKILLSDTGYGPDVADYYGVPRTYHYQLMVEIEDGRKGYMFIGSLRPVQGEEDNSVDN